MKKLPMLGVEEAQQQILAAVRPVNRSEQVMTLQALDRVLSDDLLSFVTVPPFDNTAMDGYAVCAADLTGPFPVRLPVSQRIAAGHPGEALQAGTAARIFTGAPVPAGADAIVMQEDTTAEGDAVLINKPAKIGEHIRRAGEDMAHGETIMLAGTRLTPAHLGVAAAAGHAKVHVRPRLRVAVFYTGDEIVMPGEALQPGQIYNSNRFSLTGLLQKFGVDLVDYGIVPDKLETTRSVLQKAAASADLVLTSGGVSVGEEDHVRAAVESLGQLDLWKIAMKPGKPLAFGRVGDTPFVGLPGNPVSTFVTYILFVLPLLRRLQGEKDVSPTVYPVVAGFDWPVAGNRREYVRARLRLEAGQLRAEIFPNQGSGVLTSVAWADGLIDIPIGVTVKAGDIVPYMPFYGVLA